MLTLASLAPQIVTGFLGSGKTTLVNYILQGEHGKKIAVIENEFGEVNIDEALVTENMQYKEDVISMDNGCARSLAAAAEQRSSVNPRRLRAFARCTAHGGTGCLCHLGACTESRCCCAAACAAPSAAT